MRYRKQWRIALLVAQGYEGVDLGGPAGRDISGKPRNDCERGCDGAKSERVVGLHAEQQGGEQARQTESSGNRRQAQCRPESDRA